MKICAVSDLHGNLPTIPECDLLIIAGDVCPDKFKHNNYRFPDRDGQLAWLHYEFKTWLRDQPAAETVMTFGNCALTISQSKNARRSSLQSARKTTARTTTTRTAYWT